MVCSPIKFDFTFGNDDDLKTPALIPTRSDSIGFGLSNPLFEDSLSGVTCN